VSGEPCPKTYKAKRPRKGLNRVSTKRARENRERDKQRADVLARGCQVCPVLVEHMDWERCDGTAVDWHEVVTRGRGGSITDPGNGLASCRLGHDFLTEHPIHAEAWGLIAKNGPVAGLLIDQDAPAWLSDEAAALKAEAS
jgi:hypothetical protein